MSAVAVLEFVVMGMALAMLLAAALSPLEIFLNSTEAVGPQTFDAARAELTRQAAAGDSRAGYALGITSTNQQEAVTLLSKTRQAVEVLAAEKDDPLAWYLIAMEKNDRQCLKRAARLGCVQALNQEGEILLDEAMRNRLSLSTNAFEKTLNGAFACFAQAATLHDANALINLGVCYQRGIGCRQDLTMAFACYRASAERGHPEAMNCLSACYELGHGIPKDPMRARFWRLKAGAVRGDERAKRLLETGKDD